MSTRKQNEGDFGQWEDLPDGGRRYWRQRKGLISGFQRMIKVVDADENTIQVVQEVYNETGDLIEQHQKYPVDTGHQILRMEDDDTP
jgi:hypothetical protein